MTELARFLDKLDSLTDADGSPLMDNTTVLFGSGLGPMFANYCVGLIARGTNDNLRMIFLFAAVLSAVGSVVLFLSCRLLNSAAHQANAPAQIPDAR